jgi:hypothetical protein
MALLFEASRGVFAVVLARFEVRETLYMLRGSYGSVLNERGGQEAEISRFCSCRTRTFGCFLCLFRPFAARTGRDSREILFDVKPRWAEFEGDPLRLQPDGQSLREVLWVGGSR